MHFTRMRRIDAYLWGVKDHYMADHWVRAFLAWLKRSRDHGHSTLGIDKAAVRSKFMYAGHPDPTTGFMVKSFLRGVRKEEGGEAPQRKMPATQEHLRLVHGMLNVRTRVGAALWAAMLLGWFFMLRVSNIAANEKGVYDRLMVLRREDVIFFAGEEKVPAHVLPGWRKEAVGVAREITAVEITVRWSKNDPHGKGFRRVLYRGQGILCPVQALMDVVLATPELPRDWPVVSYGENASGESAQKVVTRQQIQNALRAAGQRLGEDPSEMGTHSLRIGGATAMHAENYSVAWIMILGNWSSPSFLIYCRSTDQVPRGIAKAMAGGSYKVYRDRVTYEERRQGAWWRGGV